MTRAPGVVRAAFRTGRALGVGLGITAVSGCASSPSPPAAGTIVAFAPPPGGLSAPVPVPDTLRMVYLGSGGWIMEHGGDQVLAGPLFTNPSIVRTGLAPIASDTAAVDRYMAPYDVSRAGVILAGHAHYDHLMDVPRVARIHAPDARILGSGTVRNTLGTWSGLWERVDLADDAAGTQDTVGRWLHYGPRVRVMPLRSMHGPHFLGITLYEGSVDTPRDTPPRWATEWLDGPTFAFLVDFLDASGAIAFRIYYQDAVAAPPLGFAPDSLIRERPVDVAVLVPATFEEVDWHPEGLVQNLRPRQVVLGHWEDLFQPVDEPAEPVPLTDLAEFERRLTRVYAGPIWRPDRFAELLFVRPDPR